MKAPSSHRNRSLEASLSLAREGSGPTPQQQERVGQALRNAGLTVPLLVAPILAGAAQAAAVATTATAAATATTSGAAGTSVSSGAATTSATLSGSAANSADSFVLGSKLVAGKLIASKLVVALAVAGAGALGVRAGYESIGRSQSSAPSMAAAPSAALVDGATRTPPNVSPTLVTAPTQTEVRFAQPLATAVQPPLNAASDGRVPRSKAILPKTEDRLVVEMQHLKAVNQALNAGNPRLALQRLEALDREIPSGALRQERRVSRVLALCALGNTEQAIALTRQLLRQNDSFYRTRLEHSCGSP